MTTTIAYVINIYFNKCNDKQTNVQFMYIMHYACMDVCFKYESILVLFIFDFNRAILNRDDIKNLQTNSVKVLGFCIYEV